MKNSIMFDKVRSILASTLNTIPMEEIRMNSQLKDDLGLDSMTSLTFLMALEDSIEGFVVDPDTLDVKDLVDVESISQYVESQLERNNRNVA